MSPELSNILDAIRAAGKTIQNIQQNGFLVSKKANNDLLTEADLVANKMLREHLGNYFPTVGWLSEESVNDQSRLVCKKVFIVDPIDGTIEYSKKIPEYAISVALVENGMPILASVYNPATCELFYAEKGKGAWLNGERIYCNNIVSNRIVLLASRSEYKRGEWDYFKKKSDVRIVGSIAYKLALVASGKAHATFSLGPKNEWDIVAGVLLVQEAGGSATTQSGCDIVFNQSNTLVDSIVASCSACKASVMELIEQSRLE